MVRLTDAGPDWGVMPGPNDQVGYAMDPFREDDCFQAAIATATQVPIEQVPDLDIDRQLEEGVDPLTIDELGWQRIERWAGKRGLELRFWDELPVPRERWIGVSRLDQGLLRQIFLASGDPPTPRLHGDEYLFFDHCQVMADDQLVFDPVCSQSPPPGHTHKAYSISEMVYGISFERKE
ncbi:MAG: hypothetical protein AABM42_12055 [Actinomycetota bacterium]